MTIKTNRMLWGRAASRCSMPECRRELVIDSLYTDDPSLIGEAAHIVAEQPDGPRGNSSLPIDQRNKYANLILLCNIHHKQVDDHVREFTVERLIRMKAAHESWVQTSLAGFDSRRQADDEQWAGYIEAWAVRAELDTWLNRTSGLLQPIPSVDKLFFDQLDALREWIFSRVWPEGRSELRDALENFRFVVNDFVNVFRKHSEPDFDGTILSTKQFYQIKEWNPELYHSLLKRFDFHVDLVHDLTYEMTRAANYVCDKVRANLDRTFRIDQGVLLVRRGMDMSLMEYTRRPEYQNGERVKLPYPGLNPFLQVRSSRDYCAGTGVEAQFIADVTPESNEA